MRRSCFLLASFFFGASAYSASAADLAVAEVLLRSQQSFDAIHTISFSSTQTLYLDGINRKKYKAPAPNFTSRMSITIDGDCFRSEAEYQDWRAGNQVKRISLYDGKQYQYFDPGLVQLTVSKDPRLPNGSIAINPLLVPYNFAFGYNGQIAVRGKSHFTLDS